MKMTDVIFSIIIPAYNSEKWIKRAIDSAINQKFDRKKFEIIVVDDCSTDGTCECITEYNEEIIIIKSSVNCGPGVARNKGMERASGRYYIFLDSDDCLESELLARLYNQIERNKELEICDFCGDNFRRNNDLNILRQEKDKVLQGILELSMDTMVIYSCFSASFLKKNKIKFPEGFHEDIIFMYKCYWYSTNRMILDWNGYKKFDIETSIINTCSIRHIEGFYNAFIEIKKLENNSKMLLSWKKGIISIAAIKARMIVNSRKNTTNERYEMYKCIKNYIELLYPTFVEECTFFTQYYKCAEAIYEHDFSSNNIELLEEKLRNILSKKWSCWDLQHSLFLRPNEIRVCCKRYFFENQFKGDVAVLSELSNYNEEELFEEYTRNRSLLKRKINSGEMTDCFGCPFLEYKDWEDKFEIKKISFEHHSICNLNCSYCSEEYYGGVHTQYNVLKIVQLLKEKQAINYLENVTWGGGEPVLDKNYGLLLKYVNDNFDITTQNIISNSTVFNEDINRIISRKKAILITSVDSGTVNTYKTIRGKDFFEKVFHNLELYALNSSSQIIIKYILLDENSSLVEIEGFITSIVEHNLLSCSFQISCNFKKKKIEKEMVFMALLMYSKLLEQGAEIVFFDELFRERLLDYNFKDVLTYSHKNGIDVNEIKLFDKCKNVVIWGSRNQIELLLNNSEYFKWNKPLAIIASHKEDVGKTLGEYVFKSADEYINKDIHIVIAAVQGTRRIYDECIRLGYKKSQIVKDIIV